MHTTMSQHIKRSHYLFTQTQMTPQCSKNLAPYLTLNFFIQSDIRIYSRNCRLLRPANVSFGPILNPDIHSGELEFDSKTQSNSLLAELRRNGLIIVIQVMIEGVIYAVHVKLFSHTKTIFPHIKIWYQFVVKLHQHTARNSLPSTYSEYLLNYANKIYK